jgi:quercetin dioxygenase-like cupin family protein
MSFVDLNKMPGREIFPGFKARFVHGENITISHVEITSGASAPVHAHVHEQVVHVVKGRLEMTIDGERIVLEAGQGAVIPSMIPHGAKALTDCYAVDTFYPIREDFK